VRRRELADAPVSDAVAARRVRDARFTRGPAQLRRHELDRVDEHFVGARVLNCLRRAGVDFICDLTRRTRRDLLAVRGWGLKTLREVEDVLEDLGLRLADPASSEPAHGVSVKQAGPRWLPIPGGLARADLDVCSCGAVRTVLHVRTAAGDGRRVDGEWVGGGHH